MRSSEEIRHSGRVRVTISDVSTALGLTKSTVSRALNGYSDISETTRNRVRGMADKMGYRPLSHAQAIRTGLSKSLGLVIQMSDHDAQRPFLAEFLFGLSQGASALGWTLTIAASDSPADTLSSLDSMARDRKVDGFVLPRTLRDDPRVDLLREMEIPFVLFGRVKDETDCAYHDIRGEEAMGDAVRHLAALGHRSIGFINSDLRYNYAHLRREGYLAGMADAGLTVNPAHQRENAATLAEGAAAATEILSDATPPTAIVCAVDMAALGVYRAAAQFGLRVGHDLSVISYDGAPEGAHATPGLSTYAVDYPNAGRQLSSLLIRRIRGEAPGELRNLVQPTFLDRGSAGPPALTTNALSDRVITARQTELYELQTGGRP